MPNNYFKSGEWNVWCMVCNRKIKSGTALKRWDGLIVCPDDYENRHPMDFLRSRQERISVPYTSDTSFDQFNGPTYPQYPFCTAPGSSGEAGFAVAGCMRPGLGFPNGLPVSAPEIPDEPTFVSLVYVSTLQNITLMSGNNLVTVNLDD
jgi:hypothetical protein